MKFRSRLLKSDEDLFRESTMTFGEHLEELRGCLFRALFGLVIGFVIGLLVGQRVVAFIQTPLVNALNKYYQARTLEKVEQNLAAMQQAGVNLPDAPDRLAEFVARENFLAEEAYIDPADILRQLKARYPKQFGAVHFPAENPGRSITKKDLIQVLLWHPAEDDPRLRAKGLSVMESFTIYLKAAFLVGVVVASPWIFWQLWSFVAAGLYRHERYYVKVYLPFSLGLFLSGVGLAFFFVFEPVLNFLFSFNHAMGIDPEPRISEWLTFVLFLPLGFGISFQLPLVMLFLERIGIFSVESYWSKWKIAVVVIAFLAAILTPSPDPWSMLLMGLPLVMLYFGGIFLCQHMPVRSSPYTSSLDD